MLALSGWMNARAIGTPLRRLVGTIRAIAGGNADVAVPDRDRDDEIGSIAGALEELRGTVQRAFAQQQMLEQMPIGGHDRRSAGRLPGHEHEPGQPGAARDASNTCCPARPTRCLGQSIDVMHRHPGRQRGHPRRPGRGCRTRRASGWARR